MNTALVLAALSVALGSSPTTPTWSGSYSQAQEDASGKKPLAVVFGSGQDGWAKMVRSEESRILLAERYVCVYVDTSSESGKKLAAKFGITNPMGIVLSDRSGDVQAYWHEGDLADASMTRNLHRFSDPTVTVTRTEREAVVRVSNYGSGSVTNGYQGLIQPAGLVPGGCPNGRCPNAR